MNNGKMKLSPPWITYVSELKALFGQDPDIKIEYDEDTYTANLFIEDQAKADAVALLIPAVKSFGNVDLHINIIPADQNSSYVDTLKAAFAGNPAVTDVADMNTPFGELCYVVFKKEVVQFYNDQMDDLNGNKSTLYQEIARDVFNNLPGVYFCTAADTN